MTHPRPDPAPPGTAACGAVFATTGADYTALARRAARTLARAMPGLPIDLFTDQAGLADPVFAAIHPLSDSFFRPKAEALAKSRFDRTLYLDADVLVLAPLDEVFALLDRFDIAAAHAMHRARPWGGLDPSVPLGFPQLNSGVVAMRRGPQTRALVEGWGAELRDSGTDTDQPALRRRLYHSDLRLAVLPPEYNFFRIDHLDALDHSIGAPRILHVQTLHMRPPGDPTRPLDLTEAIGPRRAAHVRALIAADPALGGSLARVAPALSQFTATARLRRLGGRLLRRLRLR